MFANFFMFEKSKSKMRKSRIELSFFVFHKSFDVVFSNFHGYSQASPRLLIFRFFQPPDLISTSRLLILGTLTFFTNPLFYFLSLLVLLTPNFHGKIAYSCIYFSFMLYDNLLLFFSSLYNHSMLFLKFRPPPFFLDPPA